MEAIDLAIPFDETDDIPAGACDRCGVPIDFGRGLVVAGSAACCRACADSGVFPA